MTLHQLDLSNDVQHTAEDSTSSTARPKISPCRNPQAAATLMRAWYRSGNAGTYSQDLPGRPGLDARRKAGRLDGASTARILANDPVLYSGLEDGRHMPKIPRRTPPKSRSSKVRSQRRM